jgi:hypothetical protein
MAVGAQVGLQVADRLAVPGHREGQFTGHRYGSRTSCGEAAGTLLIDVLL